ncbi:hypothetical protein AMTRI_Chr11g155180 [Amborella trichopoda]
MSLLERTVGACIFTTGAYSQNAGAPWVRQMTIGEHTRTAGACIQNAGVRSSIARALWLQRLHCWSGLLESVRTHCDCRSAVLHCRSAMASEARADCQSV